MVDTDPSTIIPVECINCGHAVKTDVGSVKGEEQYICKVAKEPKEIAALIEEAGFTYVCEKDWLLFFKKPK